MASARKPALAPRLADPTSVGACSRSLPVRSPRGGTSASSGTALVTDVPPLADLARTQAVVDLTIALAGPALASEASSPAMKWLLKWSARRR